MQVYVYTDLYFPLKRNHLRKYFSCSQLRLYNSLSERNEDGNEFPIILSVQLSISSKIKGIQKLLFDL